MPLINCEITISFPWSKQCVASEMSITSAVAGNPNARRPAQAREARQKTDWSNISNK